MTFSRPNARQDRPEPAGAGVYLTPSRVPRARFFSRVARCRLKVASWFTALLLATFNLQPSTCSAAYVVNWFQNPTNPPAADTNYLIITKISPNILATGGVIPTGIPVRTPRSPWTNFLAAGFYSVTNPVARGAYVINVYDNGTQEYDYTNLLYSGYNTYANIFGSNLPPSFDSITNALGYFPASPTDLTTTSNAIIDVINDLPTGGGGGSSNYIDTVTSTNFSRIYTTNAGRVTVTLIPTNLPAATLTGTINLATGTNLPVAGIAATGIGAGKYLRGDGTWDDPPGDGGITAAELPGLMATNNAGTATLATNVIRMSGDVPSVIYDVNGASDIEDAGSLALASALHRDGKINLKIVMLGGTWDDTFPVEQAARRVMDFYGAQNVPIAGYRGSSFGAHPVYTNSFYTNVSWPHIILTNSQQAGVGVFQTNLTYVTGARKILAESPDNSIYFHKNQPFLPFKQLMDSPADDISPLTGEQLMAAKVRRYVIMAGDYPDSHTPAGLTGEYNFSVNPSSATNVYQRIAGTADIYWTGFSIGSGTMPGTAVPTNVMVFPRGWTYAHPNSPLYNLAFNSSTSGDIGRSAWASVGLLFTAYGTNTPSTNLFTYVHTGTNSINGTTGSNWWSGSTDVGQAYMSGINTNEVQRLINYYLEDRTLVVDREANKVQLGLPRLTSLSGAQESRLELNGGPALDDTNTFSWLLQGQHPTGAGVSFAQAFRVGLGRFKVATSFSPDTLVRHQILSADANVTTSAADWTTLMDWKKTNIIFYVPLYGNALGLTNFSTSVLSNAMRLSFADISVTGGGGSPQTNIHWAAVTNLTDRLTTFAATNPISGDLITSGTVVAARIGDIPWSKTTNLTERLASFAATNPISGDLITSGTVADARIASTIARDSEVTSAISALNAFTNNHTAAATFSNSVTAASLTLTTGGVLAPNAESTFGDVFADGISANSATITTMTLTTLGVTSFYPTNMSLPGKSNSVAFIDVGGNVVATNFSGALAASSAATNYTVPLLLSSVNNTLFINAANTNIFITFTGTNVLGAERTIVINALTNTLVSRLGFISTVRTNSNFNQYTTNGTAKILHFLNVDTTGTNVLVTDGGRWSGTFTQ